MIGRIEYTCLSLLVLCLFLQSEAQQPDSVYLNVAPFGSYQRLGPRGERESLTAIGNSPVGVWRKQYNRPYYLPIYNYPRVVPGVIQPAYPMGVSPVAKAAKKFGAPYGISPVAKAAKKFGAPYGIGGRSGGVGLLDGLGLGSLLGNLLPGLG